MGIPGLTTFVDANPHLLTDHELRDTTVIVDGNNLYHFLYYYFHVPVQYGGEYGTFDSCIEYFFRTLAACHITPYVVFDGGYDVEDRKLPTVLRRARDRCHMAGSLAAGGRGKVLPILAHETFRCTLNRLRVRHYTCDSEADEEIAALANRFGCPVMSNDSDFYVYDLTGGFIVLDYLDLKLRHLPSQSDDAVHYLAVQIYFIDTLLGQFINFERRELGLFATLQGTDVVEKCHFHSFLSSVKLPPPGRSKAGCKFATTTKREMLQLLLWLEEVGSYDAAVSAILQHTPSTQQTTVSSVLTSSVCSYTHPSATEATCHAAEQHLLPSGSAFDDYKSAEVCRPRLRQCALKSRGGRELPAWFLERIGSGDVSVTALNALVLRRLILLAQVEVRTLPSAYICALSIRSATYRLLLSVDFPVDAKRMAAVSEYDRVHKNMRSNQVAPSCDACQLPKLVDVPMASDVTREGILLQVLGVAPDTLDGLPVDSRLIVAVTCYWVRHAIPRVSADHLTALLLCHLKQAAIDPICRAGVKSIAQDCTTCAENLPDYDTSLVSGDVVELSNMPGDVTNSDNAIVTDDLCDIASMDDNIDEAHDSSANDITCSSSETLRESVTRCCDADDVQRAANMLARFTDRPSHNRAHPFNGDTVHAFSQWQSCRHAANTLNQLLLSPLDSPSPASSFSGIFLYNVSRLLETKSCPDRCAVNLLGSAQLARHFTQLYDAVVKIVPDFDSCLSGRDAPNRKAKKRDRKRNGCKKSDVVSSGDETDDSIDEIIASMKSKCDLSNRYDFLRFVEND